MDLLFLILLGGFIIISVIFRAAGGGRKAPVRMLTIIISAVLAFCLARPVSGLVCRLLPEISYSNIPLLESLLSVSPSFSQVTDKAYAIAVTPVVYMVIFFILYLISCIVNAVICRNMERGSTANGALLGVLTGVLSFVLLFAPLTGFWSIVYENIRDLPEDMKNELVQPIEIPLPGRTVTGEDLIENNRVSDTVSIVGKPVLFALTRAKINGQTVSLAKETDTLFPFLVYTAQQKDVLESGDFSNMSAYISEAFDAAENSPLLTAILNETLTAAAEKWTSGEAFLGLVPDGAKGITKDFMDFIKSGDTENMIEGLKEKTGELFEKYKDSLSGDKKELAKKMVGKLKDTAKEIDPEKVEQLEEKVREAIGEEGNEALDELVENIKKASEGKSSEELEDLIKKARELPPEQRAGAVEDLMEQFGSTVGPDSLEKLLEEYGDSLGNIPKDLIP